MREKALKEARRIHDELSQIDTIVSHVKRDWNEFVRTADDAYLKAVAYDLQGFYTGFERILESVADTIDDHLPAGENWHKDLLDQMSKKSKGFVRLYSPTILRNYSTNLCGSDIESGIFTLSILSRKG